MKKIQNSEYEVKDSGGNTHVFESFIPDAASMQKTYVISSSKLKREIIKKFHDETEARHWVINHLDLSGDWTIELSKIEL